MIKYRKAIFTIFIILAFIASLIVLTARVKDEKANRVVNLCLDYNSMVTMCHDEGLNEEDTLNKIKESGIISLAFSEMNLDDLQEEGKLRWMTGSQLQGIYRLTGEVNHKAIAEIHPARIYIINAASDLQNTILENSKTLLGKDFVREIQLPVAGKPEMENIPPIIAIELMGNIKELPYRGLGFDRKKMSEIYRMGFKLVLRPENRVKMDSPTIKSYLESLGKIPGVTCLVFGGTNEVLGYPLNLDDTVTAIKESKVSFGDIEAPNTKARQKGATYVAQRVLDQVVRVQSITPQYLAKMRPENAIDIFRLGVRERNIRLLYLRPYPRGLEDKSVLQTNLDYFAQLKKELKDFGFVMGQASRFPNRQTPGYVVILISLGTAGIFMLLLNRYHYDKGYIAIIIFAAALVFPAGMIVLHKLHWAQKIIGLVLGVIFPVYAFAVHFEEMGFIEKEEKLSKVLGYAFSMLMKITLVTILGGLILSALFSSTSFMLGVDRVRGVKVLLFLPPIIIAALYYIKGTNKRETIEAILKTPLYLWQVAVMGFLGVLGLVFMMRSGNSSDALTTGSERQLRVALEQLLWVRPRFKDFVLGHPSLMITWALSYMGKYAGLGLFVLFGAVGQADIMDTFAHVHTPLFISLVRVINGVILGAVIGTAAICIYWMIRRFFCGEKKSEAR